MDLLPIQDLYSNLFAAALWKLIVEVPFEKRKALDGSGPYLTIEEFLQQHAQVRMSVARAAAALVDTEQVDERLGGERFREFLRSPEATDLTHLLLLIRADPHDRATSRIHEPFLDRWAQTTGLPPDDLAPHVPRLVERLATGCDDIVRRLGFSDELGLADLSERRHFHLVEEQLALISRQLRRASAGRLNPSSVADFRRSYRAELLHTHSEVEIPDVTGAHKVALEEIYVPALLKVAGTESKLSLNEVLDAAQRIVVLGDPGGGKSTLTHALCAELAASDNGPLPVWIELRAYHALDKSVTFEQYLEIHARATLGLHPPRDVFEQMLDDGDVVLILDGLDELLAVHDRAAIRDRVDRFARQHPNVQVIVTSRRVGYPEAPLSDMLFTSCVLTEFSVEQVDAYVRGWFGVAGEGTNDSRAALAQTFLERSEGVPELRSNPLLLSLMCALYRDDHFLPEKRADLYEECARLLFRRWDGRRGIVGLREHERHVEPLLEHLAHWIYTEPSLARGVRRAELEREAASFFMQEAIAESHKAREAARALVEFCTGRAWVLTDTGADRADGLYEFTHRSFLDYFAATYLENRYEDSEQLQSVLAPRVLRGEWLDVAELVYALRSARNRRAAGVLLDPILHAVATADKDAPTAARFLANVIKPMALDPPTADRIGHAVASGLIQGWEEIPTDALASLLEATDDIRPAVCAAVQRTVMDELAGADARKASIALRHLIDVSAPLSLDALRDWRDALNVKAEPLRTCLTDAATRVSAVAIDAWCMEVIELQELLDLHGPDALLLRGRVWGGEEGLVGHKVLYDLAVDWRFGRSRKAEAVFAAYGRAVRESWPPHRPRGHESLSIRAVGAKPAESRTVEPLEADVALALATLATLLFVPRAPAADQRRSDVVGDWFRTSGLPHARVLESLVEGVGSVDEAVLGSFGLRSDDIERLRELDRSQS